jgi:hypothetical protein
VWKEKRLKTLRRTLLKAQKERYKNTQKNINKSPKLWGPKIESTTYHLAFIFDSLGLTLCTRLLASHSGIQS